MSSKRETILARIETALAGTTGVSTRIYRDRTAALAKGEHPALLILPSGADTCQRNAVGRLEWVLPVSVHVLVYADTPHTTADPIVADVHSKLAGDATLQNLLVDWVPVNVDFQFLSGDGTIGHITMNFSAAYQTAETSIT